MRLLASAFLLCVTGLTAQNPSILGIALGADGGDTVVRSVLPKSPAEKAGLLAGDRLRLIGEHLVTSPLDARIVLYHQKPGPVKLTVVRDGKPKVVEAKVIAFGDALDLMVLPGIPLKTGGPAPAFWAENWDLPEGMEKVPTLEAARGKAVCLFIYQAL